MTNKEIIENQFPGLTDELLYIQLELIIELARRDQLLKDTKGTMEFFNK